MRYSTALSAAALVSSALAISITTPSSSTEWDFSTPKTIEFDAESGDPPVVSIILIDPETNFQIKIADNVKTSEGEYTTQPNPSVPDGDSYQIRIIDSSGTLAESDDFTVEQGASNDGSPATSASAGASTSASTSASSSSTVASASASASNDGSPATTSAATSSTDAASSTLQTATVTAAQTTAASATPSGAASSNTLNKMNAGVGALLGLAFLFA